MFDKRKAKSKEAVDQNQSNTCEYEQYEREYL
jgi:hypothetical protein